MIEIEKKFQLREGDEERLLVGAVFQKEVVIHDTYWDTKEFAMTGKDWWLRLRDGQWELKIALHKPHSGVDQYEEIENELEIGSKIDLIRHGEFIDDLRTADYEPMISIVTKRRKYQDGEFHIDIDSTDFGFTVAEIELMVEDHTQIEAAAKRVMNYADAHGLFTGNVRGKVLEYLVRFRPDHYRALCEKGVARA